MQEMDAELHEAVNMINPKLKNLATDYTDRHGFLDQLPKMT